MFKHLITPLFFLLTISFFASAQPIKTPSYGKGIKLASEDTTFETKIGFRFQTLYRGDYNLDSDQYTDRLTIRRSRLKFDGFVLDPKFTYKVELALSNQDHQSGQINESGNTSNIILDAVLKWKISENSTVWFGQTKLPGNRERVISSQKLQFVDRSLVNSLFNLDRGMGVQLHRETEFSTGMVLRQAASISMGEGRNITASNPYNGYDYTLRLEWLPMGNFTSGGDYFGSDLKREERPKLSIGSSYDWNFHAVRSRGNLGQFISDSEGQYVENNLYTLFLDAMFKYQGFSYMAEYAHRTARTPSSSFGIGSGIVNQMGYLFANNVGIDVRHTMIFPEEVSAINEITEYTLGVSKFLSGHNLKFQSDITYRQITNGSDLVQFRFQTEVAF